MTPIRDALIGLIEAIVDEPERVVLEEIPARDATLFELEVAPDDVGKVIGRQGRTIRALRTLLNARGARGGERYDLEIID